MMLLAMATLAMAAADAGPKGLGGREWADVTSFGARGDGVSDDTPSFLKAAATRKSLRIPRPPAHYKLSGKVRVYGSIVGDGSMPEIRMYGATGQDTHAIFEVSDYRGPGLVFRGLHLNGQWGGADLPGEWSHLIAVKGSKNVTIESNILESPHGDCVLVGGSGNPRPSEHVIIRNNRMVRPRRCCIALTSAKDVIIRNNDFHKMINYVAAIDLEPNPDSPEPHPDHQDFVEDVEIADNRFDAPGGIAIQLHSPPGNRRVNRRVNITSNTAKARRFLLKGDKTGAWEAITVANNTFLGDPDGSRVLEHVAFVEIDQDPQLAPSIVSDVTVVGNTISSAVQLGQTYRDYFRGVRRLRLLDNRWQGSLHYKLQVKDSPDAQVSGNQPAALPP